MRLGRYQEAEAVLRESLSLHGDGASEPRYPASDARLPLSLMASVRGDFAVAVSHGEAALRLSLESGHALNERIAHYALARAAIGQGQFLQGETHARDAFAACELAGDRWFMADCHLELGDAARGLGRHVEAERHYATALDICREFGNQGGMAEALNRRADLALSQLDYAEAHQLFLSSLAFCEAVSERREIARAECGLGDTLSGLEEPGAAAVHYRRALRQAERMRWWPLVLRVADGTFALVSNADGPKRARELLTALGLSMELSETSRRKSAPVDMPRVVTELEIALLAFDSP